MELNVQDIATIKSVRCLAVKGENALEHPAGFLFGENKLLVFLLIS